MSDLPHPHSKIVEVAKYVIRHGHTGPYSTGESLAGAIAAGDAKALRDLGYSFADAIDRIGEHWTRALLSAEVTHTIWEYKLSLQGRRNA